MAVSLPPAARPVTRQKALAPGLYWFMFPWQYGVVLEAFTVIPEGKIGLILSKDGAEIPTGNILGRKVDCDNFQDSEKFLLNGGQKGRQTAIITAGTYRINTQAFAVTVADMTVIREKHGGYYHYDGWFTHHAGADSR